MSGTATTQLGNGMAHRQVWPASMIELVVVVAARLHAHPRMGRDEGMPRHPTFGLPALAEIEERSQVHRAHPAEVCADGEGEQAPPRGGAETIVPLSGHHHRRRQGCPFGWPAAGLVPHSALP
jgi:hypothetical protein